MHIDRVNLHRVYQNDRPQISEKQKNDRAADSPQSSNFRDTVEISASAKKRFLELKLQRKMPAMQSAPLGFSEESLEKVISTADLSIRDPQEIASKIMAKVKEKKAEQAEKLERVKARLKTNYYGSHEVIEKIARNLIREMNEPRVL